MSRFPKVAFVTGISGQDGAYLAKLLISKGYEVHGLLRRSSVPNTGRLEHLLNYDDVLGQSLFLHDGDLGDAGGLDRIIGKVEPDEIYNLGAQSDVACSFTTPEYTANVDALGTLRILESIRNNDLIPKTRFYQASTSELYGLVQEIPQSETTQFYPRSPYAVAKLYAYWITVNYREAYGMYACNGILFNHESPLRGHGFVTRKITKSLAEVAIGKASYVALGNLDSLRDWGHAEDYVYMQWLMLQQDQPLDFVIATGRQSSVRQFFVWAGKAIGLEFEFKGAGDKETAVVTKVDHNITPAIEVGQEILKIDPRYYRPSEVDTLLGDAKRAAEILGWQPLKTVEDLCSEMMINDLKAVKSNLV